MSPRKRLMAGVSLIELMVSLVIGSMLIIGAVTVYMQSRNTYRTNESAARLQETARYVLDVIATDPSGRTLVFVEVKTRTGDGFGGLAEAVTGEKVRRIRRLAGLWLAQQECRWPALRLDVIGVRLYENSREIRHLKGVG